jgi:hypothetical protein
MGLLMKSTIPGLSMSDPAFDTMYSGANVQPRSAVGGDFLGDDAGTVTETETTTETQTDMAQMYLEWAASNPNATLEQAFSAGADIALGQNQPIGLGMVDEFEELSPFDQVVDIEDQVDDFSQFQPQVDTFEEGMIDKKGWRDTVIDISDVQGPQG